jgi:hypothetical protein
MAFSDTDRMFRAVAGHYKLRAFFDLHVGYNGSIVNRHGIELFLVAADLSVHRTWSRVQWVIADVMDAVISSSQPGTEILSTRMPLD